MQTIMSYCATKEVKPRVHMDHNLVIKFKLYIDVLPLFVQILGTWYAMEWWPPSHLNWIDHQDNYAYTATRNEGKEGQLLMKVSSRLLCIYYTPM